jgi:hypothetical protein
MSGGSCKEEGGWRDLQGGGGLEGREAGERLGDGKGERGRLEGDARGREAGERLERG